MAALDSGQSDALRAVVAGVRAADLAEVTDLLDDEQRSRLIYTLPPRLTAEVVVLLDEAVRGEVVEELDTEKLTEIVAQLPPDDAADVLAELPLEHSDDVLDEIPRERSDQIAELLTYEEASAGSIMNPELLSLPAAATVAEAVEHVRAFAPDEDVHYVYVVDDEQRLTGIVPLRRLVVNDADTELQTISDADPVSVLVDEDQEIVLHLIRKYDVAAVAVVDSDNKLLGRITYDDVMDVAEEEADEDIFRMAGTDAAELETHSAVRAARVRMAWLIPCIIGTLIAGGVIALFGESLLTGSHLKALVIFVPMIAATSGNAGIQASTIVLRGIATGELAGSRLRFVFQREIRIAALVALMCSSLTGAVSALLLRFLQDRGYEVAAGSDVMPGLMGLAVGLGMLCAIVEAVGLGITLPFIFRRFGVDPAIASGPLITSANDLLSVTVYLGIALAILT